MPAASVRRLEGLGEGQGGTGPAGSVYIEDRNSPGVREPDSQSGQSDRKGITHPAGGGRDFRRFSIIFGKIRV